MIPFITSVIQNTKAQETVCTKQNPTPKKDLDFIWDRILWQVRHKGMSTLRLVSKDIKLALDQSRRWKNILRISIERQFNTSSTQPNIHAQVAYRCGLAAIHNIATYNLRIGVENIAFHYSYIILPILKGHDRSNTPFLYLDLAGLTSGRIGEGPLTIYGSLEKSNGIEFYRAIDQFGAHSYITFDQVANILEEKS